MKKILILLLVLFSAFSCNKNNDLLPLELKSASIVKLDTPESFEFGQTYQLTLTYNLPSSCYKYFNIDYEYNGSERNISVLIYLDPKIICPQVTITAKHSFYVKATQYEDYTFNIWKGRDSLGQDIIESIVVPVTN